MPKCCRGFTLVELLMLISVVSIALVGVLLVFQNTVRGSADPQIYKQSLSIAEAMLDEVLTQPYDNGPAAGLPRANFDGVDDYAGYNSAGIVDLQGNAIAGLADYNVAVAVVPAVLNGVNEAKRITVTVTHPRANVSIAVDGYRVRYIP